MLERRNKEHGLNHRYDLFRSTKIKVCMPVFDGCDPRNVVFASSGARSVIDESGLDVELVTPEKVNEYDMMLISMLSVQDTERMLLSFNGVKMPKTIVGGQGCISIRPIKNIVDVAHFGRAEGCVRQIIDGALW